MSNAMRMAGTVQNLLLFAMCFLQLHRMELQSPGFVLYLCLTIAFGWLIIGDIGHWGELNLSTIEQIGPGVRFTVFRVILGIGLIYSLLHRPRRKS